MNNGIIIEDLLDFWNKYHHENENDNERHPFPSTYSQVKRKDVDQGLFIATESSIVTYGEIFEAHTSICKGKLQLAKRTMEGHVISIRLSCTKEKSHS